MVPMWCILGYGRLSCIPQTLSFPVQASFKGTAPSLRDGVPPAARAGVAALLLCGPIACLMQSTGHTA